MSTQENGLAANVTGNIPAAVSISSSAASGSVCLVTTGAAHLLTNGDTVAIELHEVNDINGQWVATVISSTTFTIPKTVFGTGTGGTVQSLGFGVTFPIPEDAVDPLDVSTVNMGFEAVADRTAFLMTTVPLAKDGVIAVPWGQATSDGIVVWDTLPTSGTIDTWQDLISGTTWSVIPGVATGDTIRLEVDLNMAIAAAASTELTVQIAIWYSIVTSGSPVWTRAPASARVVQLLTPSTAPIVSPLHLQSIFTASGGGALMFKIMGMFRSTATPTFWQFVGDYIAIASSKRLTGAAQS
jgi:hypothetical protein